MSADLAFRDALSALSRALESIPAPSMIIGGVAVIAAGVPRSTIDIDATILGRDTALVDLVSAFERQNIRFRIDDGLAFARERNVLLLIHEPSSVTIEVSMAWLPFEEEALNRAVEIQMEGFTIRVAKPEDLVIYKAAAWRDRDRADIERLLVLHIAEINLDRVRALVEQIGQALDDQARLEQFDAIVARVRDES
jgi:predicted nucleotidyltransferase